MKSDFKAAAVLVVFLAGITLAIFLIDSTGEDKGGTIAANDSVAIDSTGKETYYSDFKAKEHHLQEFDPNTADSTLLLDLGLQEWMVRGIYKYRAKGGVYSSPEDFAHVPGLTVKQYNELKPYIRIGDEYKLAADVIERPTHHGHYSDQEDEGEKSANNYPKKISTNERVDINHADTTELMTIPGIGSYYAKKIVELRDRLGGFTDLDQLSGIKNFPEDAFQYMIIPDGGVQKININRASFTKLMTHPYIGRTKAKEITDYRRLKGKIKNIRELSLSTNFTEEDIDRLEPYIEY